MNLIVSSIIAFSLFSYAIYIPNRIYPDRIADDLVIELAEENKPIKLSCTEIATTLGFSQELAIFFNQLYDRCVLQYDKNKACLYFKEFGMINEHVFDSLIIEQSLSC